MKTAILCVGGERSLGRTIDHLKANLLDVNQCVVFFACETDNPQRVLDYFEGYEIGGSLLIPSFQTKEYSHILSMCLERPGLSEEVFERARKADGLCWTSDYIKQSGTLIQYYQLWKAWCLLLEYERTHEMKFDICVKWRLDALITKPLVCAEIPSNQSEEVMRSMGNPYMLTRPRSHAINPYYEHVWGTPFTDNIVWSFGPEQVFITSRKNFACLGSMVFWFGLWDSGGPFAFNSETFFHEVCKHNQLVHWVFLEHTNPMITFEPDYTHILTLLR